MLLEKLKIPKAPSILLAIHFVLWLGLALLLDVHPDMADHWLWSKFLFWGYYEHPPFVAFTFKLVTLIGGNHVLTLKIGAILYSVLNLYLAYQACRLYFNEKAAFFYLLALEATLYFSASSIFWHIDQPFMMFWLLGLLVIAKWNRSQNPNWMLAFGVIAGLGAMSKYIMILLPMAMFLWVIQDQRARQLVKKWQTYAGATLAVLLISPNLYWNATHDWATFNYNLHKGLHGAELGTEFLVFTMGHLFLFSIVFSSLVWFLLFRKKLQGIPKNTAKQLSNYRFLVASGLVPALFFSFTSFKGNGADPHWLNITYFSLFMLLGQHFYTLAQQGELKRVYRLYIASFILNGVILTAALVQIFYNPLGHSLAQKYTAAKVIGWGQSAQLVEELLAENNIQTPPYVMTREYHLASGFSLYLKEQPATHTLEKPIRNQWSKVADLQKMGVIFLCPPVECQRTLPLANERIRTHTKHIGPLRFRPTLQFEYLGEIKAKVNGQVVRHLNLYYSKPHRSQI